jgi:hypothetical protein
MLSLEFALSRGAKILGRLRLLIGNEQSPSGEESPGRGSIYATGYAVLLRIEQMTGGALLVEQGALYPALFRLEHRGLLESEWGVSDNNRRASTTD